MGIQIGVLHVRRSSVIQATTERVWQELGSFERGTSSRDTRTAGIAGT